MSNECFLSQPPNPPVPHLTLKRNDHTAVMNDHENCSDEICRKQLGDGQVNLSPLLVSISVLAAGLKS